jgi:hypothetical protein
MNKLVLISALNFWIQFSLAQNSIQAKLVDASNEAPIAGASIILFSTTLGTKSDGDGGFSIESIASNKCEIIITDATETYLPIILANIGFGTRTELNLGTIGMFKKSDPIGNLTDQCLTLDGKKYKAQIMDGGFRYILGQVAIIFMDKQATCE